MNETNRYMKPILAAFVIIASVVLVFGVQTVISGEGEGQKTESQTNSRTESKQVENENPENLETATFGGGCFWCTEAVFQQIKGVKTVESGYCGGHVKNPTYEQVCGKKTGHAEVIRIMFDPKVVDYKKLLEVHWKSHDPTTLNQQGADKGPQYRSAIFYHSEQQKEIASAYKKKLDESGAFGKPIVTEITAADTFYPAEDYHQNYFNRNPSQGYCAMLIGPKVSKIRKVFADDVKPKK